jgi:hypothetical protein
MTAERGWFQPQLFACDQMLHRRWAYWHELVARGSIGSPAEWPIPRLEFGMGHLGGGDSLPANLRERFAGSDAGEYLTDMLGSSADAKRNLFGVFERCLSGTGAHLSDLIHWLLWAFGSESKLVPERPRLPERAAVAMYHELELHRLMAHPADWMAALGCEYLCKGNHGTAWFPTPIHIATCMVAMQFHDESGRDLRPLSVCDPCAGTGVMLLAASNYSLNLWAQDIDPLMCAMCEVNAWLYMPWLVWPAPWLKGMKGREPVAAALAVEGVPAVAPVADVLLPAVEERQAMVGQLALFE